MESFSGLLKNELIHRHSYRSQAEAIADVTKYIEVFVIDKAWRSLSGGICQKSADETKAADCHLTWRPNLTTYFRTNHCGVDRQVLEQ